MNYDLTQMSNGNTEPMAGLVICEGKAIDGVTVTYYVPTLTNEQKTMISGSVEAGAYRISGRQRQLAQQRLREEASDYSLKFVPL